MENAATQPSTQSAQPVRWGDWMAERASFVGYRSIRSFINEVGCGYAIFAEWRGRAAPPKEMHRGFDLKLARALRVDPMVLFSLYTNTDPRSEEITLPAPKANEPAKEQG